MSKNFQGRIKQIHLQLWTAVAKIVCADSEAGDFYLTRLPLSDPQLFPETWTEESCLVFVVNLSLCRTPERGSSECSKLGIRTLWPQPVQRQIGLPVLYVKLPARKHRPTGYSAQLLCCSQTVTGSHCLSCFAFWEAQEMGRTLRMEGG